MLVARYATVDAVASDAAYVQRLRQLVRHFPHDVDAQVLLAEALLIPVSWDYFHPDGSLKV